uniref:Uncharacterized protein n=1 Tax=Pyxicephalus adspersus TaxID=30357 RepID=A0AAV2ZLI8_PYXAD|nr:TPA: hypothetical protein GDO54_005492 [Pyxicephalus adspersus]
MEINWSFAFFLNTLAVPPSFFVHIRSQGSYRFDLSLQIKSVIADYMEGFRRQKRKIPRSFSQSNFLIFFLTARVSQRIKSTLAIVFL